MTRLFIALIAVFAVNAANAGYILDSEYPSGTDKNAAFSKCTEVKVWEEGGAAELSCPVMKEAKQKGYGIGYLGHEHGASFILKYNGQEIELNSFDTDKVVYEFKLSETWEPSWHDQGVAYGVFEFRYKEDQHTSVKTPYALIYRDNMTVSFYNPETQEWAPGVVTSVLVVVQLDGASSKVIGIVDSIKAFNEGKIANELARECADSVSGVSGKGNAASCFNSDIIGQ